jgi:hypothetical protein
MKLWHFTFEKRRWFWKGMELRHPLGILWKLVWYAPFFVTVITCATVAAVYEFDLGTFQDVYNKFF